MLRLLTLLLSCVAVCAQPVLSLNDPTVVAKSSSLLQGLVGYWQLEESSGTRYDRSPNGNHLTAVNSPGSATGKVGNAITFTSSATQYCSIESNNTLEMGAGVPYTITFWARFTTLVNNRAFIGKWSDNGTTNEFAVLFLTNKFTFTTTNGGLLGSSYSPVVTNTWYFVACWNDLNNRYISINNNAAESSTSGYTPAYKNKMYLGAYTGDGATVLNGAMDEIGIWKRVLTSTELTKLYRSGLGVTYPRFSMRDNRADDFNWDTWEPLYDKPKPFPTLYAFVNRREPEPLLTLQTLNQ